MGLAVQLLNYAFVKTAISTRGKAAVAVIAANFPVTFLPCDASRRRTPRTR
jgi:hypothetical protein